MLRFSDLSDSTEFDVTQCIDTVQGEDTGLNMFAVTFYDLLALVIKWGPVCVNLAVCLKA